MNIRPVGAEMFHADGRDEANRRFLEMLRTRLRPIYYRLKNCWTDGQKK
jgi:hypothetical protein